jgi:lysine 2,3-aminomutase
MAQRPALTAEALTGTVRRVKYIRAIDRVPAVPDAQRRLLRRVTEKYAFCANDYYLGLIDWTDPGDPIRRLIIPSPEELREWGQLDASNEAAVTVSRGVQHKYPDTVLLLCTDVCGGYCRYCFRKRLFMRGNQDVSKDVAAGIRYIARHPEVTNVLLSGGDPLIMSTRRLREILTQLRAIPHVRIIRIGSKVPAFNPFRILGDPGLQDVLRANSTRHRRIYLMTHFDHPHELTPEAVAGLAKFIDCGVICANQCPLIRGINDDAAVLGELYRRLSWIGCTPYYLFQNRPTVGNEPYQVPLVRGWQVFQDALARGSGLAGRPRYVMSHAMGKVEIMGVDQRHVYLRCHRAKSPEDQGRCMVFERNDAAYWLDQLTPAAGFWVPPELDRRRNGDRRRRSGRCHGGNSRLRNRRRRIGGRSRSTFRSGCDCHLE